MGHRFDNWWELTKDVSEHTSAVLVILIGTKIAGYGAAVLYKDDGPTIDMIHTVEWWVILLLLVYLAAKLFVTLIQRDWFDGESSVLA